jgi:hypothetical protein
MHAHHDTATNTAANAQHPFAALTPDQVLDALASVGLYGDGRLMALSSYENRVYQVTLEDGQRVVAKFYRPERWSQAQILEEHAFAAELTAAEVPAVARWCWAADAAHAWRFCLSRSAPGAAGAGPSWTTLRCWNGLAAFWRASTPWARRSRLPPPGAGRAELWRGTARLAAGARDHSAGHAIALARTPASALLKQ